MFFYNTLINFLLLPALPLIIPIVLFSPKRRESLFKRLGFNYIIPERRTGKKRVWVHALSVGEVRSAVPLVSKIAGSKEDVEIIFTASTQTGFDTAQDLFSTCGFEAVKKVAYFPYDLKLSVKRIYSLIGPDAVIIVETDIWPNFLYHLARMNIPVFLVNARLSQKSFKGYQRLRFLFSGVWSCFTAVGVQTVEDLAKFKRLGVEPDRLLLTGNMKFDQRVSNNLPYEVNAFKNALEKQGQRQVLIAGSTHEGEEEMAIQAFLNLDEKFEGLVLIIAPRDPGRVSKLSKMVENAGMEYVLLSRISLETPVSKIYLVDSMGILAQLYAVCDIAFVGGSLVNQGGHNPLEPAAWSKPVLFGTYMEDFRAVADLLVRHKAALQVENRADLEEKLEILLSDSFEAKEMGQKAGEVFFQNQGAVNKTFCILEDAGIV